MADLLPILLMTGAAAMLLGLVRAALRRRRRRGPARPPAEEVERVFRAEVARVERLSRRHGRPVVLTDAQAANSGLVPLGLLSVTAPDRDAATRALRNVAQRQYSTAQAIGHLVSDASGARWQAQALALPPRPGPATAVIDGSNVAHWNADHAGGPPSLDPVIAVVRHQQSLGVKPIVIFDANIGYRVGRSHLGRQALARRMPAGTKVIVMPRGCPADPAILARAAKSSAVIISNDIFRDATSAQLILKRKGCYVHGALHLTAARP